MPTRDPNSSDDAKMAAFLPLFESCQRSLFLYIVAQVPSPDDAHDVLQETNLVLWTKFDRFEPGTNFFAWAREIARYQVLRFRQLHGSQRVLVSNELIETLAIRSAGLAAEPPSPRMGALRHCLGLLPAADHDLIRLRYGEKMAVKSLAAQTGRSENSVSQSLRRIRRTLKQCVQRTLAREGESQ